MFRSFVALVAMLAVALVLGRAQPASAITATSTIVTSSANPSALNVPVTLIATITPSTQGPTPTGTVIFTIDGTPRAPQPVNAGQAIFNTSALSLGPHTVTADYSGDGNYFPSSSPVFTQTVIRDPVQVTITPAPNPSVPGQPTTFTVMVAPSVAVGGTPTGTVALAIDGGPATTLTLVNGVATYTTTFNTFGNHTAVANYSGDATFQPGTGTFPSQGVNQGATTTTLAASQINGLLFHFTATVTANSPAAGAPTGTVTLSMGLPFATAPLAGGVASFTLSIPTDALVFGGDTFTIAATYNGDANFRTSVSAPVVISQTGVLLSTGAAPPAAGVVPPAAAASNTTLSTGCNQVLTPASLTTGANAGVLTSLASGFSVSSIWVFNNASHTFQGLYFAGGGPTDVNLVGPTQSVFLCGTGSGTFRGS